MSALMQIGVGSYVILFLYAMWVDRKLLCDSLLGTGVQLPSGYDSVVSADFSAGLAFLPRFRLA